MNKERLQTLATFLLTVPFKNFDMALWQDSCGTVGCALGWACTIPEFREAGLKMKKAEGDSPLPRYTDDWNYWDGFDAGAAFFDISETLSYWLFHQDFYFRAQDFYTGITPQRVAERIEKLIACTNEEEIDRLVESTR